TAGPGEPAPGAVRIVTAPLERGAVVPGAGLALVAEADLTGRRRVHRRARGARRGVDYYDALEPGDYVVHHQHGVGRYLKMERLAMGGVERDYLWLEFKDGRVYVPTDQVGLVRKYTGGESPMLNRMGGADFKAVQDGKQVMVLVPTTLLASQHGQTFRERFANYPVRVEVLSRFLTPKEQAAVARDLASGAIDVVIGTHRLLSDDVKTKDL